MISYLNLRNKKTLRRRAAKKFATSGRVFAYNVRQTTQVIKRLTLIFSRLNFKT